VAGLACMLSEEANFQKQFWKYVDGNGFANQVRGGCTLLISKPCDAICFRLLQAFSGAGGVFIAAPSHGFVGSI
jgi:hypothetical protein